MPEISILISTFNRKELVKRAIDSVIGQTFTDFELFVIDDESTDGTQEEILRYCPDKRLTYIYNDKNQAKEHGDKVHIRRFVHELARGRYWLYLDSDDYLIPNNLLARQIALFEAYPDAAMVAGGQKSYFVSEDRYSFTPGVYPHVLESDGMLEHFAKNPIGCNIIVGATLYNRAKFIQSGALIDNSGRWESGFELILAPSCYGSHIYIDEPCVCTEIRPENASFNETQWVHFMDSVASVRAGFRKAMIDFPERGLAAMQRRIIEKVGEVYLGNASHARGGGALGYCSPENLSRLVEQADVDGVLTDL